MIYDTFMFFNELDLLEIRLNYLSPVVDRFVLVESTMTHTGKQKPLLYAENNGRFTKFLDKVTHIVVDMLPHIANLGYQEAFENENYQRNQITRGLGDAKTDDVILLSDVDEIPTHSGINWYRDHGKGVYACKQKWRFGWLNTTWMRTDSRWIGYWAGTMMLHGVYLQRSGPRVLA